MSPTTHILVCAFLAILIPLLLVYFWVKRHWYIASMKYNGPISVPLIGSAWMFLGNHRDILMKIYNMLRQYDSKNPMRFWLGPHLVIVFTNPVHVEKVLSSWKFYTKHDIYEFIKVFLGEGLVSGSSERYRGDRRTIQPMLDMKFFKGTAVSIQNHIDRCMANMEKYVDQGKCDIHHTIRNCMSDIVKEIILGLDEKNWSQLHGQSEYDTAIVDVYTIVFLRMVNPHLQPNFLFNMTSLKKWQDASQKVLRGKMKEFIEASKNRINNNPSSEKEFIPIIDKVAQHMENNEDIFIDHMLTLFAASEDTLTIIGGFLPMCFGMYPEYQEKAAMEIRDIFGDVPRAVTLEDISKLNYVDMCIKDSLRLFPIAPIILRKCKETTNIDKWPVPKDCAVAIPIFNIHRDEKYWENPHHFHPDHFLPEAVNKRHIYAYVPFSAGPRGCVGKIFANIALKIYICNLLQRYEIEAEGKLPDLELMMDISTRPKHGYHFSLKKRVWK